MINRKKKLGLFSRFKYAALFVGARQDIMDGRVTAAEQKLEKLYELYEASPPTKLIPIRLNVLSALIFYNMADYYRTLQHCRLTLDQIRDALPNRKGEKIEDELHYLMGYCKNLVEFAESAAGGRGQFEFGDLDELRAPRFDRSKVDPLVLRTFPLQDTSWWANS